MFDDAAKVPNYFGPNSEGGTIFMISLEVLVPAAHAVSRLVKTNVAPAPGSARPYARRKRPLLQRWPVPLYLLVADITAFVAVAVLQWPHPGQVLVLATILFCYWLAGLYRSRLSLSLLNDLPFLAFGVLGGLVTELATRRLLAGIADDRELLRRALTLLVVVVLIRGLAYTTVRRVRRTGQVRHPALILGAGHVGLKLCRTLQEHREYGLDPVGFVDSWPRVEKISQLPALLAGGYEQLTQVIQSFDVRVVIVAFGSVREEELVAMLRTCDRMRCEIFFIPRLFEMNYVTRDMDEVRGIPLIRVRRAPYRRSSWTVKRLVDVVVAAIALVGALPVLAACALALRIEGGPGVLFRQQRVGLDGRQFTLLKFRSLKPAAEQESATRWNIAHDCRLGPVGRFLRKTSLDELPQLWNVLTGTMSLVGPRPERPHFVREFSDRIPRYMARHRVPAGMTGWAQVNGLRGTPPSSTAPTSTTSTSRTGRCGETSRS